MADEIRNDATDDKIQHGLDDNPTGDAEKGAALGGVGGLVTGAIAGAAAGPAGAIIGAVVGGVVGAAASGAAVAAVDQKDNDDNVTGIGDDVSYKSGSDIDHNTTSGNMGAAAGSEVGLSESADLNRTSTMGSGTEDVANAGTNTDGELDSSNSLGMGIREATNFTEGSADQATANTDGTPWQRQQGDTTSGAQMGDTAMGDRGSSDISAGDWDARRDANAQVGTGMGDQAAALTDVDTTNSGDMQGTSGTWQGGNLAGTGAGTNMTGTGEGGWERDNDANTVDVNTAGVQPMNVADANEGGTYVETSGNGTPGRDGSSFAYADSPDEEAEKGYS